MPTWSARIRLLAVLLAAGLSAAGSLQAAPPAATVAALQRGINLTGWFRFPASLDPASLRRWMGDAAIGDLHRAGFGFVRLAVDPAILSAPGVPNALVDAIRRLQRAGLAVIVSIHPNGWHLETDSADRDRLSAAWRVLGPLLAPLDPRLTVAELLNEPVFPHDAPGWQSLQHRLLAETRRSLPNHTILLSGNDWSSVGGLAAMTPEADTNTLYTVHLYEPVELTSLAAWRPNLDRAALARLPFPAGDDCDRSAAHTDPDTAGVIRYYCVMHWDPARVAEKLHAAAAWSHRFNTPVLLGEFGATAALNPPARLAWLRAVRQSAEAAGIGWALWGYDDIMGLNVARPPGSRPALDPAVLNALGLVTTAK